MEGITNPISDSNKKESHKKQHPNNKTFNLNKKKNSEEEPLRDIYIHKEEYEALSYAKDPKIKQFILKHRSQKK